MKLSCTDFMIPGDTYTKKAERLRKWGIDAISVFAPLPEWNEEKLDELLHLEEKTGIAVCEFCFAGENYGRLMDKDPAVAESSLVTYYTTAMEVCKKLNAVTEIEYEYQPQYPIPLIDIHRKMPKDMVERYIGIMGRLAEMAEGSGAQVIIEPINRYETYYLTRLSDCYEIVDALSEKGYHNIGLLADFFHIALEEYDPAAAILDAGKRVRHVHLGDHNRLEPGRGRTDWEAGMRALKKLEFSGYMNFECAVSKAPDEAMPEAAAFMRKVYERA